MSSPERCTVLAPPRSSGEADHHIHHNGLVDGTTALGLARVDRVVFGAWEPRTGAAGSLWRKLPRAVDAADPMPRS